MIFIGGGVNNFGDAQYHGPVSGGEATAAASPGERADVGVLTVLSQEIRAVRAELERMGGYHERSLPHGPRAYEATLSDRDGERMRVAAVQTLRPGTNAAATAYRGLVEEYNPAIVLLVGIAGGISPRVRIGDVVVSDQIIAYDARRETAAGPMRRGDSHPVEAALGHRLNDFFVATPESVARPAAEPFRMLRGPIGSGNAVVTDAGSEIRRWLRDFHERVLAVETEAAGVAQSFHESLRSEDGARGWLTVRGISDTADAAKGHDHHDLAAGNAARVMTMLLPFLRFDRRR